MAKTTRTTTPATASKTVGVVRAAMKAQGLTTANVAEATGLQPNAILNWLSGKSSKLRLLESYARMADFLKIDRDAVYELGKAKELNQRSSWLFENLVASGMSREELVAKVKEVAVGQGLTVRLGANALRKVLAGDRTLSAKTSLDEVLSKVFENQAPDGQGAGPDAFDLAAAFRIIAGRAFCKACDGELAEATVLGAVGGALHLRDQQWREHEADNESRSLSTHSKTRYYTVDRALDLVASGEITSFEDFGLPKRDLVALAEVLLGLVRPHDQMRIVEDLGAVVGTVALAGEATDVVAVPKKFWLGRRKPAKKGEPTP